MNLSFIYRIGIWICAGIYNVASIAFKIFLLLATGEVVSPTQYQDLITNFYIIIGVIMLFVLAFALLRGMVNPDDQNQGTSTVKKVIINLITSGIILALLPTIFAFLYDFQDAVFNQNTIGRFFNFGNISSDGEDTDNNSVKRGAHLITNSVFTAFFNVNPDSEKCNSADFKYADGSFNKEKCQETIVGSGGVTFAEALKIAEDEGKFSHYSKFAGNIDDDEIDFNFLLSLIVGFILIYVAVSYCFDMALRVVKLVFYQVIAPIPLFLRIIPNGKFSDMFSKWTKVTLTCYAEVYVRIFVFYFVVYLCNVVRASTFLSKTVYTYGFFTGLLANAFVILGLVMFMRQAPKVFSEITGIDSGNMKIGIKDKLRDSGLFAAADAVGGLVAGHGNPLAAVRGFKYGWNNADMRNVGSEATRRRNRLAANEEAKQAGQGFWKRSFQRMTERGRAALGLDSSVDVINRKLEEGTDPRTGETIQAVNDTRKDIYLRDDYGEVTDTISVGSSIDMDTITQEKIETTRKANAVELSAISEILRNIQNSEKSNELFISLRSALKKEALEKIAEDNSTITGNIAYVDENGQSVTFTGNLASLYQFRESRKMAGASAEELQIITEQIGEAKDEMWQDYANQAIKRLNGISNEKIRNIYDQMSLVYTQDGLQSGAGVAYDRATDQKRLNELDGIEFVNAVDSVAKEYNNDFVLQRQTETQDQARIQEQNAGLDRLSGQLTERQEQVKQSNTYRAATANSKYIRQNNNGGSNGGH